GAAKFGWPKTTRPNTTWSTNSAERQRCRTEGSTSDRRLFSSAVKLGGRFRSARSKRQERQRARGAEVIANRELVRPARSADQRHLRESASRTANLRRFGMKFSNGIWLAAFLGIVVGCGGKEPETAVGKGGPQGPGGGSGESLSKGAEDRFNSGLDS